MNRSGDARSDVRVLAIATAALTPVTWVGLTLPQYWLTMNYEPSTINH